MRDVDLLLRKTDARRAVDVLARFGFRPTGVERYHHLPPMARTHDGATITIELHHKLLFRIPFVPPRGYDDLIDRSQGFDWGAMTCRALGNEDMLWHVYAHAFVSMPLLPGAIRLLSVADLVHATEACVDRLDWVRIGREYPRLVRALHIVDDLVPWSPHVVQVLREHTQRSPARVRARPIPSDRFWSLRLLPNVLWLQEWWFRMRYGITSWPRWAWYRFVGHPAHLALPAGEAIMRRLRKRFFARPTSMS
jgi:glycosyltransferase involved in cell wall biosynthesis